MADPVRDAIARRVAVGRAAVVGPPGPPDPTRPGAQAANPRAARASAPTRDGFTLIELLVALAVFSLAALALLNLSAENTRSAARVETRTLGGIVAENLAVETMIAPAISEGTSNGQIPLAGRPWTWTRTVTATAQPDLLRVHITVKDREGQAAERTLFRSGRRE